MTPPVAPAVSPADIPPDQLYRIVNLALGQNQILEMIANGAPLGETLNTLMLFIERDVPEMLCSVLLLDADGVHLRHGAAPSLPAEYSRMVDGQCIGPRAGSCGTAAFLKQRVVVADIDTDPLWADYRDIARRHGLRACWSTPVFRDSSVIATFAMYFRQPGTPAPIHEQLIGIATHIAAIAIGRDLREQAMRESDERFRLVGLATNDAVWDWDVRHNRVWWNDSVQQLFGYRADDVGTELGWWIDRVHPDDRGRLQDTIQRAADGITRSWDEGYRFRRSNGTYAEVQDRGYVMRDDAGTTIRLIGVMQDVTERRRAALEIEHLAFHEPITQLPNRTMMQRELAAAVATAAAYGGRLSLLLLNLNHFRDINDSLGHSNGDILLQRVAQRLVETVGNAGRVASLGGDEFAVLQPRLTAMAEHDRTLAAIFEGLQHPFELAAIPIKLEATAGAAFYPADGKESQLIWQRADVALRTAKERRDTYLAYHRDFDHYAPDRVSLIANLETALTSHQLTLHYQPKIDLRSGKAVGIEALIRWKHPSRGLVPPDQFLPLAERTDLINPLTSQTVAAATRDGMTLAAQGYRLELAINLSVRSLHDPAFCRELLGIVRKSGFPTSRLTFEITETAILSNPARARAGLALFRDAGIQLAMDDFGVGQSSLTYLKDLPMTRMKIDKSFVIDLDSAQNSAIVRSAVDMARNLGMHVTAEGVEQEAAFYALRAMGCDEGQGFLFSPALPLAALLDWLRDSPWRPDREAPGPTGG
jgi:diguanylate cyclase (GGDEF)-like protein/PAS domain S-box-containing protein